VHILTKILVVFASVFAVLISALTISYAVNSDTVVRALKDEKAKTLAAETRLNMLSSEVADAKTRENQNIGSYNDTIRAKEQMIRDLESQRTDLLSRIQTAITEKDLLSNRLSGFAQAQANLTKTNDAMREETISLRAKMADATKKEVQILERNADLESQNEVKDAEIRALREQVAELRVAAGSPSGRGPGAGGAAGVVPPPAVPVRGKVLEVRLDTATGQLLAMVGVGANDQIKENMVMMVYRGNEFLANLHISRVDLQSAIGRIDTLNRKVEVRANDDVTTAMR
jgi:hypothetical protein